MEILDNFVTIIVWARWMDDEHITSKQEGESIYSEDPDD